MGTSTRNKGQSGHTPLIPTWLADAESEEAGNGDVESFVRQIPFEADPNRFRGARSSFTQYLSGHGRNSAAMKRTVSHYVSRSLGGSSNAVKRLGSARNSTGRLYGVLSALSAGNGCKEGARLLSLDSLKGISASEFFIRIASFVCPDGGPNDEGLARSAYYDSIADNPILASKTIEHLSSEDIDSILKSFMTKVVMQQLVNDIANKMIVFPDDVGEVSFIEEQVEQLIRNSVSDAFVKVEQSHAKVTNAEAQVITDRIYREAYTILERVAD